MAEAVTSPPWTDFKPTESGPWTDFSRKESGPWDDFDSQQTGGETLSPEEAQQIDKISSLKIQILKNQEQARSNVAKANLLGNVATAIDLPGAFHSLFQMLHTGTGKVLDAVGVSDYRTAEQKQQPPPNAVSPEQIGKVAEFLNPFPPGTIPQDDFTQGVQEGLKELGSSFTSLENLTLMAAAKEFPGPVGAGFAGSMIGDIPAATQELLTSKSAMDQGKATVRLVGNVALPKLVEKGLEEKPATSQTLSFEGKEEANPIIENAKAAAAPETAKALQETADLQPGKAEPTSPEVKAAVETPVIQPEQKGVDLNAEKEKGQEAVLTPATAAESVTPSPEPLKADVHRQADLPPPSERPLGIVAPSSLGFFDSLQSLAGHFTEPIKTKLRAFAMESLPKITASNREVGEAGTRMAAAPIVARAKGLEFSRKVIGELNPVEFGTALSEDNLRSIPGARSLIGARNSPFQTESAYQEYLARPDVQEAILRHKQLWTEQKDPLFREANDLDPSIPLATRGVQTGARINLKAIIPGETATASRIIGGTPSLIRQLATLKRRDPFGKRAKGTGESYEGNYNEIMANGFERELPVARQHEFIRKLIEAGDAKVTDQIAPADLTLKNENTKGFLLTLNPWKGKFLQVRNSLAPEYQAVSGLSESGRIPYFTKAAEFFTRQSIVGLAEGTTHASNLLSQVLTGPGPTSNPLLNALLKTAGRADLLYTLPKTFIEALRDNRSRMLDLAEIGAAKEPYSGKLSGPILNRLDQGVRIVSDDLYRKFAEQGWVENTETARREFINQVGNYNKRLQPKLIRLMRESQLNPFATAMHTFNVMGLRRIGLGSGARAATPLANMALRADILGSWVGTVVLVTALNKLVSGTATGPPGTRLGAVGWVDDDGKTHEFNVGRLTGLERGLRLTGVLPAIESQRLKLPPNEAVKAGVQSVAGGALGYVTGPAIRVGYETATGKSASIPSVQKAPIMPPQDTFKPLKTQLAANIYEAAKEANPGIGAIADVMEGKPLGEILSRQAFRYTPQTIGAKASPKFPKIVQKRELEDYADDLARRARQLPKDKRAAFINEELKSSELQGWNKTMVRERALGKSKY